MQMYVEIGGGAKALDQGDRTGVGSAVFESRLDRAGDVGGRQWGLFLLRPVGAVRIDGALVAALIFALI